jgi:hypothetical protein
VEVPVSDLRSLSQRLGQIADRVADLGDRPARRIESLDWQCPRGRRAHADAQHLASIARRAAGSLSAAAHELARAGEHR